MQEYLYPALLNPPEHLSFNDQYAFRPTGSTTALIIDILDKVTSLLESNEYVIMIALDFSKAFDTIRHDTLFKKYSKLDIADELYNWLISYFKGRSHYTEYAGLESELRRISASIVQGSGLGPYSYLVAASDLRILILGFFLFKYADDKYLITTSQHSAEIPAQIDQISAWAACNNMKLNHSKTKEIIFHKKRIQSVVHLHRKFQVLNVLLKLIFLVLFLKVTYLWKVMLINCFLRVVVLCML